LFSFFIIFINVIEGGIIVGICLNYDICDYFDYYDFAFDYAQATDDYAQATNNCNWWLSVAETIIFLISFQKKRNCHQNDAKKPTPFESVLKNIL
jgi:hypothetical protein